MPPKGFLKLNAAAATPRPESTLPRIRRAIESFRDDADDAAAGTRAAAGRRPPATTRAGVIVRVVTDDALTIAIAGAIADAGKARIRLPTAREDSRCWRSSWQSLRPIKKADTKTDTMNLKKQFNPTVMVKYN